MVEGDTGAEAGPEDMGDDAEFGLDSPANLEAEAAEEVEVQEVEAEQPAKPEPTTEELQRILKDAKGQAHQERAKRREAENQAREARERYQALEQRLQAAQEGPRPDPQDDPIGYLAWLNDRVDQMDQREAETAAQARERENNQRVVNDVITRTTEYDTAFKETTPDYFEAVGFLNDARTNDFIVQGYSPQDARNMMLQEALGRASNALNQGRDPAEIAYSLAKSRGFGSTLAADAGKAKLERIQQGQRAASPLAAAGGRGGEELSLESVNKLTGAAFTAAAEKLERQMIRRERGF